MWAPTTPIFEMCVIRCWGEIWGCHTFWLTPWKQNFKNAAVHGQVIKYAKALNRVQSSESSLPLHWLRLFFLKSQTANFYQLLFVLLLVKACFSFFVKAQLRRNLKEENQKQSRCCKMQSFGKRLAVANFIHKNFFLQSRKCERSAKRKWNISKEFEGWSKREILEVMFCFPQNIRYGNYYVPPHNGRPGYYYRSVKSFQVNRSTPSIACYSPCSRMKLLHTVVIGHNIIN